MNHWLVGHGDKIERFLQLAEPPFLLIAEGELVATFRKIYPKAKVLNVARHSFNPLDKLDHMGRRAFATALWPEKDLMTYDRGKRALVRMFKEAKDLNHLPEIKHSGYAEARETVDDLLLSPVLESVLCGKPNFYFTGTIIADLDRAILGDDDARVLATLLALRYKGQVIIDDFDFYARDFHASLMRQNRLICSGTTYRDLKDALQSVVVQSPKSIYRVSLRDAEELIVYTKHIEPGILVRQEGNEYTVGS